MAAAAKQATGFVPSATSAPSDDEKFGKTFTLHNATLRIYEGGIIIDKETKKPHNYEAGIKIKFPFMEKAQKISPRVLSELFWQMSNDEELKTFVRARIADEKSHEHDF